MPKTKTKPSVKLASGFKSITVEKKKSKSKFDLIETKMVEITPEIAGDLLAKNTRNRKISEYTVKRLAQAIKRGEWEENGETIKIAKDGTVIDGQHRLAAVVMANKSIHSLVVTGLKNENFETIDIGRSRRMADFLYINGEHAAKELASTLTMVYRYNKIGSFAQIVASATPTPKELQGLLNKNPEIRECINSGRKLRRKLPNAYAAIMSALHFVLRQVDETDADLFFDNLASGEGLSENDPILRLRDRLLVIRGNARASQNEVAAITIKAWNAYRAGKKVQSLSWRQSGPTAEAFPTPI